MYKVIQLDFRSRSRIKKSSSETLSTPTNLEQYISQNFSGGTKNALT